MGKKSKGGKKATPAVRAFLGELGKEYGRSGGLKAAANMTEAQRKKRATDASAAAADKMTDEQKKKRAEKAARARWGKPKPKR